MLYIQFKQSCSKHVLLFLLFDRKFKSILMSAVSSQQRLNTKVPLLLAVITNSELKVTTSTKTQGKVKKALLQHRQYIKGFVTTQTVHKRLCYNTDGT